MKKRFLSLVPVLFLSLAACGGADVGPGIAHAEDEGPDTGGLIIPEIRDAAIAVTTTTPQIAIDAGYISNGSTVSLPTGFTAAQCKFTASVATINSNTVSTRVGIATTGDSVGLVTCLRTVQEREEIPATTEGCVASYTMICVK